MKRQGVSFMETVMICIAVFAGGWLLINEFFPQEKTEDKTAREWFHEAMRDIEQGKRNHAALTKEFKAFAEAYEEKFTAFKNVLDRHESIIGRNKDMGSANKLEISNFKHRDEAYKKEFRELKNIISELAKDLDKTEKELSVKLAVRDDIVRQKVAYSKYYTDSEGKKKRKWTIYEKEYPGDHFSKEKIEQRKRLKEKRAEALKNGKTALLDHNL